VVVRSVVVRKAPGLLEGAEGGAQARPRDRRRRGVPVLAESWVDWQGSLWLRQFSGGKATEKKGWYREEGMGGAEK
jgi:hypothetical protein